MYFLWQIGVFDEQALRKGFINFFQKWAIFRSPIEKMVANRYNDLPREEESLFEGGLDEAALVRTKVDNGRKGMLFHGTES